MKKALKLALLHMDVGHKQVEANRARLVELAGRAAGREAKIILAPELAVSGYSFSGPREVTPFAETARGPTAAALAEVARRFGVFIAFGLAEKDAAGAILHNSALVLGPDGKTACIYRKINAESRWACPGDPVQDNTFETPWGRVGLLICSDTYYGLMPRITALRGADLLLVPANWPIAGIDPQELWSARALENGFALAACNRTGIDRTMDCRKAPSVICDNRGRTLAASMGPGSRIVMHDLPLDANGRLESSRRKKLLAARRPEHYHGCYLDLRPVKDLTSFFDLPPAGRLNLLAVVPSQSRHPAEALNLELAAKTPVPETLCLVPVLDEPAPELETLEATTARWQVAACACTIQGGLRRLHLFRNGRLDSNWTLPAWPLGEGDSLPRFDFGPARITLAPMAALRHPEPALAASKQGCDLAIAIEPEISAGDRLLAGARTIENLAIAACGRNLAGIWQPPEGHRRWAEDLAEPGQACRLTLDTGRTRQKRFQDRVDFRTLLAASFNG